MGEERKAERGRTAAGDGRPAERRAARKLFPAEQLGPRSEGLRGAGGASAAGAPFRLRCKSRMDDVTPHM